MSNEPTPQEEVDPRAPLQAGDEGGIIEESSSTGSGNDPTPNDQQPPP